jgi:hypothetical protein
MAGRLNKGSLVKLKRKYTFAPLAGPVRLIKLTIACSRNLLLPIALQTAGMALAKPIA